MFHPFQGQPAYLPLKVRLAVFPVSRSSSWPNWPNQPTLGGDTLPENENDIITRPFSTRDPPDPNLRGRRHPRAVSAAAASRMRWGSAGEPVSVSRPASRAPSAPANARRRCRHRRRRSRVHARSSVRAGAVGPSPCAARAPSPARRTPLCRRSRSRSRNSRRMKRSPTRLRIRLRLWGRGICSRLMMIMTARG